MILDRKRGKSIYNVKFLADRSSIFIKTAQLRKEAILMQIVIFLIAQTQLNEPNTKINDQAQKTSFTQFENTSLKKIMTSAFKEKLSTHASQ